MSTSLQPDAAAPLPPDLQNPDAAHRAVAEVSMRLLAGAVDRRTLDALKASVQGTTGEYPWQAVTHTLLAAPADPQKTVQAALVAQRDWILRGGRETPRPLGRRAKGLLAKLVAQLLVFAVTAALVIAGLLLLKYRFPEFDIYRVLTLLEELFGKLRGR